MDSLKKLKNAVIQVLEEYANSRTVSPDVKTELVFDTASNHYQILNVGWQNGSRVHGIIVHIDLIEGKAWIQHNGTEVDFAQRLMDLGVSRNEIVLGFHSPAMRKFTEFAVG